MKTVDQACLELGRRVAGYPPREMSAPVRRMFENIIKLAAVPQDLCALKALEEPETKSNRGAAGRAKNLANRMARLQEEYIHWEAAIKRYHGHLSKIAARMGCSPDTAHRAIRDLGLQEEARKARAKKHENK